MSESLIFVTMLRTNYRCCSLTQFVDTDRKKNLSSSVVRATYRTGEKYLESKYFFPYFKLRINIRHK